MAQTDKSAAALDAKKQAESAEAHEEAEAKKLDETVPGGRYKRGDTFVNAEGEEIK